MRYYLVCIFIAIFALTNLTLSLFCQALGGQYATSTAPLEPAKLHDPSRDASIDSVIGPGAGEATTLDEIERFARITPLRLSYEERGLLRLLESTLDVSEYTDKVDIIDRRSPAKRMANEIKFICAVLSGLVVAHQYDIGQKLIKGRGFKVSVLINRWK